MSAAAVGLLGLCLLIATGFGGRHLGWGIRAVAAASAPESVRRIGWAFLAAEVWALAAIALFPALFPGTESLLASAGWFPLWLALGAWLLRDLALWWWRFAVPRLRPLLGLVLSLSSLVLASMLGAGIGWSLTGALGPVPRGLLVLLSACLATLVLTLWPRAGSGLLGAAMAVVVAVHVPWLRAQAESASSLGLVVPALTGGLIVVGALQLLWWACDRRRGPTDRLVEVPRRDTMGG